MPREDGGRLVHRLGSGDVASLPATRLEPPLELGLRPEALDVGSSEGNVVPERAGRNQEMNESARVNEPILHLPRQPIGSMRFTIAEKGEYGQGVPRTVGPPPPILDPRCVSGADSGERVRHAHPSHRRSERCDALRPIAPTSRRLSLRPSPHHRPGLWNPPSGPAQPAGHRPGLAPGDRRESCSPGIANRRVSPTEYQLPHIPRRCRPGP
jgi:hypothetical protein